MVIKKGHIYIVGDTLFKAKWKMNGTDNLWEGECFYIPNRTTIINETFISKEVPMSVWHKAVKLQDFYKASLKALIKTATDGSDG